MIRKSSGDRGVLPLVVVVASVVVPFMMVVVVFVVGGSILPVALLVVGLAVRLVGVLGPGASSLR